MNKNQIIEAIESVSKAGWLNACYPSVSALAAPVKTKYGLRGKRCGSAERYAVTRAIQRGQVSLDSIDAIEEMVDRCYEEYQYSSRIDNMRLDTWLDHARAWQAQADRLRAAMQSGNPLQYSIAGAFHAAATAARREVSAEILAAAEFARGLAADAPDEFSREIWAGLADNYAQQAKEVASC